MSREGSTQSWRVSSVCPAIFAALLLAVAFLRAAPVVAAGVVGTGTPQSCTETALDAALASGGLVTFDCGPDPVTITITSTKVMDADTTIDGGSLITISGGNSVGAFSVSHGVNFTVQNLTIANGNRVSGSSSGGGAILNRGTLTVTNSTFSGNSANNGGGIRNNGTVTVTNTIIANSTNGDCVNDGPGPVTDGGHNMIGDAGDSCGLTNGVNGNIVGVDPLLDPAGLKDNGGPTQTIALLPNSPAIDAGDPEVCANLPLNGPDQRGFVRPGVGHGVLHRRLRS